MSASRRFYFDDGRSRKRWHVQAQGKSQVVHYGRLGGSLRESKKAFKSPAEATEQTEKLIATKKREGYLEINPARLEIKRLPGIRAATEEQIKALEKRIGCGLSEEYRQFLRTQNGGHPNPDCVAVVGVEGIDNVGVGALFHLQPSKPGGDELMSQLESAGKLLPPGHLPIAGSSDLFTLSLKPKTFGSVFWFFHETDELDDDGNFLESAGYLLAGSFDEFLTRIALPFGDTEELESAPSASAGGMAQKTPKATIRRLLALIKHDHTPEKVQEIEHVVTELGDLSGIQDGQWPFINIDSPQVLRCLLNAGLNPEINDNYQQSLLWQCAGNRECIDLLVKHGVNIHRRSGSEAETALMRAIYVENIPAVKRLVQLGANPTLRLSWPIEDKLEENAKLRKVVEKARADWRSHKEQRKETPQAVLKPKHATGEKKQKKPKPTLKRLLQLLKHDYIPEEFDGIEEIEEVITELGDVSGIQDGQWPTIDRFEEPRLLRSLLAAGLNPEITAKDGSSLLSQCVMSPECIDLLIKQGVTVDRPDRGGETALMRATYMGDEECVKRLLAAGADPTLEFSSFAKVMLNMKVKMKAFIEAARDEWKQNRGKRKSSKSVAQNSHRQ
ncbi:MAG: ankyrin repeat domain-containing protein [Planctomycetes bacterium]|nr:ankyrin repeat domain-containing protein [Planctomycetota bacterium]